MIKLFSLKQQKKDGEESGQSGSHKKSSAAQLRIQKGVTGVYIIMFCSCLFSVCKNSRFFLF